MATRRRSLEIDIVVDDKNATKNLGNVDKQVGKTGKAFSDFAKVAAGALAFDRVVDFARSTITAFSDLNESVNAVEVTFGEAADGILKLGENAAESVGLSNAEFNSLAVGFSAFVEKIAGAEGASVADTMDDLTVRISDFASVMNLEVADAAEKFRSGLAGETEPLRKFGIDVSAAAVTQEALASGLAESSTELTEQDKILARYNLIMEQTEKTAGDFANTSDDLANSTRILGARFADFQAQLGEQLVPAAEEALAAGSNLISAFDEDVNLGWSQRLSAAMQTVLGDSVESVQAYIKQKDELNNLADAARGAVPRFSRFAGEMRQIPPILRDTADAASDAADATESLAETQLAAADPAFNLLKQYEGFVGAQQKYNQAVKEFGPSSLQAQSAAAGLLSATGDYSAAQERFNNEHGPEGEAALRDLARAAGIYSDDIQEIINRLGRMGRVTRGLPPLPSRGSTRDGTRRFHEGGVVQGTPGSDVPIMAQAGETIGRRAEAGGGGGVTVLQVALDGRVLWQALKSEALRDGSRNGSTGIT